MKNSNNVVPVDQTRRNTNNNKIHNKSSTIKNLFIQNGIMLSFVLCIISFPFSLAIFNNCGPIGLLIIGFPILLALLSNKITNYNIAKHSITVSAYLCVIFLLILYLLFNTLSVTLPQIIMISGFYKPISIIEYLIISTIIIRLTLYINHKYRNKKIAVQMIKKFISLFVYIFVIFSFNIAVSNGFDVLSSMILKVTTYILLVSLILTLILTIFFKKKRVVRNFNKSYKNNKNKPYNKRATNEKYNANNAKGSESPKENGANSRRD